MRCKVLGALALTAALLFSGCTTGDSAKPAGAKKELTAPTKKVAGLMKKYGLENSVVDFEYTKKMVAEGTRNGAKALLIDARPEKKYIGSTIPSSLNIPDTKFDEFVGQLDDVSKDKEIIVYCGGWHCGKSPKVAGWLKERGFTNVKLYQAGEPDWKKKNYVEVGTPVVAAAVAKNGAFIIDARPYKKFLGATIPGSIAIPDTECEDLSGRYPVDKSTKIITFCGGYKCHKSHVVARSLIAKGYTNVNVYAAGMPAYKKAGHRTTGGGAAKKAAAPKKAVAMLNGIKPGVDEGTVDGEWFKANIAKLPANVQIVDVRSASECADGTVPGSINIEPEKLSAAEFVAKLPADKTVVFHCASGGRAMEAQMKAVEGGRDASKTFYFDANFDCKAGKCAIEVNEPLF